MSKQYCRNQKLDHIEKTNCSKFERLNHFFITALLLVVLIEFDMCIAAVCCITAYNHSTDRWHVIVQIGKADGRLVVAGGHDGVEALYSTEVLMVESNGEFASKWCVHPRN